MASLMIGIFATTDVTFAVKDSVMGSAPKSSPPVSNTNERSWILSDVGHDPY